MGEDGSADLQYVRQVAKQIGQTIIHDIIVVDKSTVPVGTADEVKAIIQEELDNRGKDYKVCVVSNPEFLKEAVTKYGEKIAVGVDIKVFVHLIHNNLLIFFELKTHVMVTHCKENFKLFLIFIKHVEKASVLSIFTIFCNITCEHYCIKGLSGR